MEKIKRKLLPTGGAYLDILEMPKLGGGIYGYLEKFKYPYKGYPQAEKVAAGGRTKRLLPAFARFAANKSVKRLSMLFFLLPKKMKMSIIDSALDTFIDITWTDLINHFINPYRYCRSGREIYRVMTLAIEREKDEKKKNRLGRLREVFCFFWEYDNAYRFRLQDILGEAIKEALRANPIKEMNRLHAILMEREDPGMRTKMGRLLKMFLMLLRFHGYYRELVEFIAGEINLKEVELDIADIYYCATRPDYDFQGETLVVRMNRRMAVDSLKLEDYNIDENTKKVYFKGRSIN